jgi:hypothetical protein
VLPIPLRLKLIDFAQQANCSLPAKSICASPAARAFSHNQDPSLPSTANFAVIHNAAFLQ